jgi:hypothetical protein
MALSEFRSSGWLIHQHDGAIYVSALDGVGEVRLDLRGFASTPAGYAGEATVAGVRWLYFAKQVSADDGANFASAEFALVRTQLGDNQFEEVLRFTSRAGGGGGRAAISPDGSRVLVVLPPSELVLVDIASGDQTLIFKGTCEPNTEGKCSGYWAPQWSPAGDAMIVKNVHWEGASAAYAGPVSAAGARPLPYGGEFQVWGLDGSTFCTQSSTFGIGGMWLVQADDLAAVDLLAALPAEIEALGCWPARDGSVLTNTRPAYSYVPFTVWLVSPGAAAPSWSQALPEYWSVDQWLPAGDAILIGRMARCATCSNADPLLAILALDGTIRSFPFAVATERSRAGVETHQLVLGVVGP